jgi:hypothetical protein
MMDLRVLLKRLILASIFLMFAFYFFDVIFFGHLPVELQQYNTRILEDESEMTIALVVGMPLFLIYLLSLFFLWKLKKIGRTLFSALWIISLIVSAAMSPMVFNSIAEVCVTISTLINGMILALIYFSDLRFYFEGKSPETE